MKSAIDSLGALAQRSRLEAFRLLVRQGAAGMPAGQIARTLGIPHNTLSAHLNVLTHAGLVASERKGRSIIYRADFATIRGLLAFLMEDCCHGRPEVCGPILERHIPAPQTESTEPARPVRRTEPRRTRA